jgi:very-short-patch-repair endonuclease
VLKYSGKLKPLSRTLRKQMTDAEILLWSRIRKHQLSGYPFCRQKIIGGYIVDFYCPRAKLIVEIDGSQHYSEGAHKKDQIRDEYMVKNGLHVLRFTDTDVLTNIDGVLENLFQYLGLNDDKTPFSPPLQRGRV